MEYTPRIMYKMREVIVNFTSFRLTFLALEQSFDYPSASGLTLVNTLRLKKIRCYFANDIFKCIFLNKNVLVLLKFLPKVPINNIPTLVTRRQAII